MTPRYAAKQDLGIGRDELGLLPAGGRPVPDQLPHTRNIERAGGRRASCKLLNRRREAVARGCGAFVPVGRLEAAAPLLQHSLRHAIGQYASRQGSKLAAREELLGRHGEAELNQSTIDERIAQIDAPTAEQSLEKIAGVVPADYPQPRGEAVDGRTVCEIKSARPRPRIDTKLGAAGPTERGVGQYIDRMPPA